MRWWQRYRAGYADGQQAARTLTTPVLEEYERLLGEARDGLRAKEAERAEAVNRADRLMDKLLAMGGVRGVSGTQQFVESLERTQSSNFLSNLDDHAFEEVAPGKDCTYATAGAALIDPLACEPEETTH